MTIAEAATVIFRGQIDAFIHLIKGRLMIKWALPAAQDRICGRQCRGFKITVNRQ
jgi:hypothetical protein